MMKSSRLISIVLALVLLTSILSIWFQSSIMDYMEGNRQWNGSKDFVNYFNPVVIDSLKAIDSVSFSGTIIAVPVTDYSPDDLARIAKFVNKGGTLILMDDFGHGNNILQYLSMNVRFAPGVLLDPLFCDKNQELVRIVSFSPSLTTDSIKSVSFNRGTSLINVGDGSEVLASSSDLSFMDLNDNGVWDTNEPQGPFVVSAKYKVNSGYIVLVTDPSILINSMLHLDDNIGFMKYLTINTGNSNELYLDRSHLITSPLDIAKLFMIAARKTLSHPYATVGVLALLFIFVSLNVKGMENKSD